MRIWDVNPGYLNRQSLLGEHREIHGLFNIVVQGKKGYSRHPETLRWYGKVPLIKERHDLLVSEMTLRGYNHHSPLTLDADATNSMSAGAIYINPPHEQYDILNGKYMEREKGRIPLPGNCQVLWAQHKYSVMAREPKYYKEIGPLIAAEATPVLFKRLCGEFVELLAVRPVPGRLMNALLHMWGYFRSFGNTSAPPESPARLMSEIRSLTLLYNVTYLLHSTALSDLDRIASADSD